MTQLGSIRVVLISWISALLSGCAPPVDETLISYFGASEETIAKAREAAQLCTDFGPQEREVEFREQGFVNAAFENSERSVDELRATLLIHADTGIVALLGKDGGTSGCKIGAKGMSPQQSYELALPWVALINGVSNEDLGQGLTPNAIQAWRGYRNGFQTFVAAYKTWDILEEPGAAVWLSQ